MMAASQVPKLGTEVKQFSTDYKDYPRFDELQRRQVAAANETVEVVLTRLDEFSTLLAQLKGDTANTKILAHTLVAQSQELRRVYFLIDMLHEFVGKVAANVAVAEARVMTAEAAYASIVRSRMFSFVPGLPTTDRMPPYEQFQPIDPHEFLAEFKKGGRDEAPPS